LITRHLVVHPEDLGVSKGLELYSIGTVGVGAISVVAPCDDGVREEGEEESRVQDVLFGL
jgi:hypothetical protein